MKGKVKILVQGSIGREEAMGSFIKGNIFLNKSLLLKDGLSHTLPYIPIWSH